MSNPDAKASQGPSEEDDLDQLLESALEDFDKPPKSRKQSTPVSISSDTNAEAELMRLFEKVGLTAGQGDSLPLTQQLEELARMAGGQTAGAKPDPEVSLKEMMQQMTADTEQLSQSLSEAELNTIFQQLQMEDNSGAGDLDKLIPMMEGMMQSLLSKDLLYPAIKEMSDKFPDWLADHRSSLPAEDFIRYNKQYEKTRLICKEFEEEEAEEEGTGSSQENKNSRFQRVMALMQVIFEFIGL
jgi:peroxin-19